VFGVEVSYCYDRNSICYFYINSAKIVGPEVNANGTRHMYVLSPQYMTQP
jgi:hypothetical protein